MVNTPVYYSFLNVIFYFSSLLKYCIFSDVFVSLVASFHLTLKSFFSISCKSGLVTSAFVCIGKLFSSVRFSHSVVSDSLRPNEPQHARPPCPSPTPGVQSVSHPSSQWCHPAISSSVIPFSSCPQSLPASESFPVSQLFAWGGQSIGVSALASFLPKKSQGWSPSEWTGWISLQSKGLLPLFCICLYQWDFTFHNFDI